MRTIARRQVASSIERTIQKRKDVVALEDGLAVTDDRVDRLLALFRTRAWSITVAGEPSPEVIGQLRTRFPLLKLQEIDSGARLEVELTPGQDLYSLLDLLREEGLELENISRAEPDLEEVFLKIVREAGKT